jgi:hypothetical protein
MAQPKLTALGPSIEERVRNAYWTPSAVAYDPVKESKRDGHSQLMSEAQLPSAIGYESKQKSFVPGPGSYETPDLRDFALPDGGRLNRNPPQDKLKLDEYPIPPPGTYGVPNDPTGPRQLYGSFGKDPRVTKFIQDEVKRSRSVPAPGEHEVMDAMENVRPFCPEGGRYMEQGGRGQGYFDHAAKISEGKPDPGRYNLPGSIRPNKAAGKLVWKYQSESLAKTKKILTKACGGAHENPAPGHYSLPDPMGAQTASERIGVPTLKGRDTGHAMPHPYAYNCAPDHARKFASVLDQNSGDQIYGRPDSRQRPNSRTDSRAAKAKLVADEVAASQMPAAMAENNIEQPGQTVQWKSGGFSTLRKVKSTPTVQYRAHPTIAETMSHYPALSKTYGRHDKTFLPNASRRPEVVKTHSKSTEYQNLQRKRWELGAIMSELNASTSGVMETLDEQKLRDEATVGLIDKAKFRLRMEGLSDEAQELVLAELPGVFAENIAPTPSPGLSQFSSVQDPYRGAGGGYAADEPFAEPQAVF